MSCDQQGGSCQSLLILKTAPFTHFPAISPCQCQASCVNETRSWHFLTMFHIKTYIIPGNLPGIVANLAASLSSNFKYKQMCSAIELHVWRLKIINGAWIVSLVIYWKLLYLWGQKIFIKRGQEQIYHKPSKREQNETAPVGCRVKLFAKYLFKFEWQLINYEIMHIGVFLSSRPWVYLVLPWIERLSLALC